MKLRRNLVRKFFIATSLIVVSLILFTLAYFTPGLKGSIDQELRIFFKQTDRIISKSFILTSKNIYRSIKYKLANENRYDVLDLHISFKNLKILKNERKKSLKIGKNLSRKKVPIIIEYKNQSYKASARLKGGLSDHYGNNKQYSLMIKLKKGKSINGMKEFSLTQHSSRQFPQNLIYSKILSSMDIQSPNFLTYKIKFNGEDWGLMLAEEQYSNAYFELREMRYSPVLKLTNEDNSNLFRSLYKEFGKTNQVTLIDYLNEKHGKLENNIYNRNDFHNIYYNNLLSYTRDLKYLLVKNKLNSINIEEYFDIGKFSKIIVFALISGEYHGLGYRNMRYYVNPFTRKFEPIPTDWGEPRVREIKDINQLQDELFNFINCSNLCNRQDYPIYDLIIKNDDFQKNFVKDLNQIGNIVRNSKGYLKDLCTFQFSSCANSIDYKTLDQNIKLLKNNIKLKKLFDKSYYVKNKYAYSNINLKEDIVKTYAKINTNPLFVRTFKNGNIKFYNLTPFNIKIKSVFLEKDKFCKKDCLEEFDLNNKELIIYPSDFIHQDYKLDNISNYNYISFEINNGFNKHKTKKFPIENIKFFKLKKNKIENLNKFRTSKNTIIIDEGVVKIENPLIIPKNYNLKIMPGSTMIFNENSYIELNGGNLEAIGTKDKKIILLPNSKDKSWKGILVKNSIKKSFLNHVVFEKLTHFETHNTYLTGAINFYKSDVDIINSNFSNSSAEDFLNIISSNFIIKNVSFNNCLSDAFDSDFSNGKIIDSIFTNVQGDAADFSGSKVEVIESQFKFIGDKSISAGENSAVYLKNNSFIESNIAIASKDKSTVSAIGNKFFNTYLYDLIAFNKKSFYEVGGEIDIINLDNNLKSKSGLTSKIKINNKNIKKEKIDLNELY